MLMGLLGGSLAAAVSIRNVQGAATPYDIPVALATLKVPSGALTAIAGLVAIRGNFVPGLSALDSQEQILAYALVLGYAQQTRHRVPGPPGPEPGQGGAGRVAGQARARTRPARRSARRGHRPRCAAAAVRSAQEVIV